MEKKIIGIIGGMGPLATADLFEKIILNTKADRDQEHLRVLIDSNTAIPDRTAALLHGGDDPTPQLVESARLLEKAGAQVLIMPCNTAHNFFDSVAEAVHVPVLHMIRITAQVLQEQGVKAAGLLATDGTIQTRAYQQIFDGTGIELLTPSGEDQRAIMDLVYKGVKAGDLTYDARNARHTMESLLAQGAETLILGCTELPLAVRLYHLIYPMTDPTLELARAAIRFAGGEVLTD